MSDLSCENKKSNDTGVNRLGSSWRVIGLVDLEYEGGAWWWAEAVTGESQDEIIINWREQKTWLRAAQGTQE